MLRRVLTAFVCSLVVLPLVVAGQQSNVLSAVAEALGTSGLNSITFTATGRAYMLGQQASVAEPWPAVSVKSYQVALDYVNGAMRVEEVLTSATPPSRGGGVSIDGERREVLYSSSSDEAAIWTWAAAPQGLIKAAGASAGLTFTIGGRYRVAMTVDKDHHIESARTRIPNDVLGDMLVEVSYSGYKNFGPIVFPSRIVLRQGGHPTLDLTVTGVKTNESVAIGVPESAAASAAAPVVKSTKVANGIYWITGGANHSMAVDMGDHIVVVEAPDNEARSLAVIAETRTLIPNKPIRYVVNTHVHFDHAGGLRTYADAGAIVVTHKANQAYLDKAWKAPRTLAADRLAKSEKKWTIVGVSDRLVLRGANRRTIELHALPGNPHNAEMLIAWLPSDKVLFQSDMISAPPPSPALLNFYDTLRRLNIQPEQIVSGHGARIATMASVEAIVAKREAAGAPTGTWETLAQLPLPEESDPVISVSNFFLAAAPEVPRPIGEGHTHQGPVIGYILQGEIETQVEPTPPAFYKPGEFFSEPAGHLHRFMRNARTTDSATLLTFQAGARGQPVPFIKVLLEDRLTSTKNQEVSLLRLTLPPGTRSQAHAHSGPGLVYVLEGAVETAGAPDSRTYHAGETLLEPAPGSGFTFRNASGSDTAKLLLYQVSASSESR